MRAIPTIYFALLAGVLIAALSVFSKLNIDTDLAGLSPELQQNAQIQAATSALKSDIEKRITLLLVGSDEDQLLEADEALRSQLKALSQIRVLPAQEELFEELLTKLMPYRFNFLNKHQTQTLRTQSAEELSKQGVASVISSAGSAHILPFDKDPFGIHSEALLSQLGEISAADIDGEQSETYALISLIINEGALDMRAQAQLNQAFDSLFKQVEENHSVTLYRSGVFFFASDAAQSSKADISRISTWSTIGVIFLLLTVFRSFRALILPVTSVLIGVGSAFILTHTIFASVHVLTIVFGACLIGIVIDYSLHFFYHAANQQSHSHDASERSEQRALIRALALSLFTSVIGYSALGFASIEVLQRVAVFSISGLVMAWLTVVVLGQKLAQTSLNLDTKLLPKLVIGMQRSVQVLPQLSTAFLPLLILCAAGLTIALNPALFTDNPRFFFNASQDLIDSERTVATQSNDFEPGQYVTIEASNIDQLYQRYDTFKNLIENASEFSPSQFSSLLDWVPSQRQQITNYKQMAILYGPDRAAELLFSTLGKPDGAEAIEAEYRAAAGKTLTPQMLATALSDALPPAWFKGPDGLLAFVLIKKGVNATSLSQLLKDTSGIRYTHTLEQTKSALSQQRKSALKLLCIAYLLVLMIVLIRYRTWRSIGLVVVPACATGAILLIATLFSIQLTLFHVMAMYLVLGFGMDYTIFVQEMQNHSNVTLQAILLSAITSLLSFGLLGLSVIPVVAAFGITLLIGNTLNLIGAFAYHHAIQTNHPKIEFS